MIPEIKNDGEYKKALERADEIFFAEENTAEWHEFNKLVDLIEKYEDEHFPIGHPP